jgi:pyrimidine operon attenuation protein/uracil phosphoribosyltransferase
MKQLLKASEFPTAITSLCDKIETHEKKFDNIAFVGIHTQGIPLAQRLAACLKKRGKTVLEGMLDINLYRDDLTKPYEMPVLKETKIEFSVNDKIIYLVDDVLYTGRTVRAALDAIFDLGRPQAVHLIVMAKRDGRELPIDTQFSVLDVRTKATDNIKVKFKETDGEDDVTLLAEGEY